MPNPACPKCHAVHSRRVRQVGFWQMTVLRRLGFYPWECRFCKLVFMLRNRGKSRRIEAGEEIDESPVRG